MNASVDQKNVVGLGEILWDLLPSGPQLGGAPANFAYHAALLGDRGLVASAIGADALGNEVLARLAALQLDGRYLQQDAAHPTGTVVVKLDARGQPSYTIIEHVAWDALRWTPAWQQLATTTDAVCFGSLAQRSATSRNTIRRFLDAVPRAAVRIFDVNLRQHYYSAEVLRASLAHATVVKLNDAELPVVLETLGLPSGADPVAARRLLSAFPLDLVCVTRGEHGSWLLRGDELDEHPGQRVPVVDTVGAGDAFTAALCHHYLRGAPLARINAAANRLGAWVASRAGATPPPEKQVLAEVCAGV